MKRGLAIGVGLLVLAGLSAFVWLREGASRRLTDAPIEALLDQLSQAGSERERDAVVDELAERGEAVVAPLLARYPTEPGESQLRMNAAAVLARLPRSAAIAALRELAKLEPDAPARDAIRGQVHMLERAEAPPAGE